MVDKYGKRTMATKWGCLGAGNIAHDFFLAIKDNLPRVEHEFVAVAARDKKRAQEFADKHQFKRAYDSYDELAKDPEVSIVYIATINSGHAEQCIKLMNAGKHVLCEKPITINLKQAKQVLEVAKKTGVFFMEGLWSRFFPVYAQIRKELAERTIGTVKLLKAEFNVQIAHVDRVNTKELGGGGLLDIGCYVISLACMVFGEMPESITAVGNLLSSGVDENACIILKYKDGGMANLIYHTNAGMGENTAVIYGDKGRIQVASMMHCSTKVTTPSGTYEFPLKDGNYNFVNGAGFQYEAAAVRNALNSGAKETVEASHSHSEMIMTIMHEIRRQLGVVYSVD